MTDKIYEYDSYARQARARIEEIVPRQKECWVSLSASCLFCEGGGQKADTGYLVKEDGSLFRVTDGQLWHHEPMYRVKPLPLADLMRMAQKTGDAAAFFGWYQKHFPALIPPEQTETGSDEAEDAALCAGDEVHLFLDWEKRFHRMQQHSGEHLIMGILHHHYGCDNVGFHLSDTEPVTLDLSVMLEPDQVYEAEREANRILWENRRVTAEYPDAEVLASMTYRCKITTDQPIRIVTIEGADCCACCAPHVAMTGEIGLIKVLSVVKYKGGTRVEILCGSRAFAYLDLVQKTALTSAGLCSASLEDLPDRIRKKSAEIASLTRKLSDFEVTALKEKIHSLSPETSPVLFTEIDLSPAAHKELFNEMADTFCVYCGLFCGRDQEGYRFLAGSRTLDSLELARAMREDLKVRGGGSAEMIQGKTDADEKSIRDFWKRYGTKE